MCTCTSALSGFGVWRGFQFVVCCWQATLSYSSVKHHINTTYLWKLIYCVTKGDLSCLDLYSLRRQGGGIFIPRDDLFPWQCSCSISHLLVSPLALEVSMSLKTSFRLCVCTCTWEFTYILGGGWISVLSYLFNCSQSQLYGKDLLSSSLPGIRFPEARTQSVFPTLHIR